MTLDRLALSDMLKNIAINVAQNGTQVEAIYKAAFIVRNSLPIRCAACGNMDLIEGGDEDDNSHEWLCQCGWQLIRQGDYWSQMMFGPVVDVPLFDILFNCVRKSWEGPDPISETSAIILLQYLIAAKKSLEKDTFMHVNIFDNTEAIEILYKNVPKERWPKLNGK